MGSGGLGGPSGVSTYPTLAESDVPPSLPHGAEAAAAHAAQDLLVAVSLHLRGRGKKNIQSKKGSAL